MNGGSKQGDESLTAKLARLEKRVNDLEERLKQAEEYNKLSQKTITSLLSTTKQLSLSGKELAHALDKLMDTTGKTLGAIHPLIPYLEKIRDREQMDEDLRRLFEK
jgi:hypothetical protein